MRAGGLDTDPLVADASGQIAPSLPADRIEPDRLEDATRSEIIAIVAPKGGQGKTTVAMNLAVALADAAPRSVLLIDGDLQFGDIANALDLPPGADVLNAAAAADTDDMGLKAALRWHSSGIFVLTAPTSPEDADYLTAEGLSGLLERLRAGFRYVIVDTAPGLGEHTLAVLEAASTAVFVTNLSVPSLRAFRQELDVLARLDLVPVARRIVINFVDRTSGITVHDAEVIIGETADVAIPRSTAVLIASNAGEPLMRRDPRDPAAKAIRQLAVGLDAAAAVQTRRAARRRDA